MKRWLVAKLMMPFVLAFYAPTMAASSKTGSQVSESTAVVSNDISGDKPALVEPVPVWSVVVLFRQKGLPGTGSCTGTLLSAEFVLTSRHCIFDKARKKPVSATDVAVVKSGEFVNRFGISQGRSVEKIYADYDGDISLLQLDTLFAGLGNFPVYHGYMVVPGSYAVFYGSSSHTGDNANTSNKLYWASVTLEARKYNHKDYMDRGYKGATYVARKYRGPPLDPAKFPAPGMAQGGDSGGTIHVFLPESSHFSTTARKSKAIGVTSASSSRTYIAAALDDDALRWIGGHVGMITAPRDSERYMEGGYIDVTMTDADVQPITQVALVDDAGKTVKRCGEIKLRSKGILGCLLPKPDEGGLYAIRAYRGSDKSYDEVDIEYAAASVDEGDGLTVYRF